MGTNSFDTTGYVEKRSRVGVTYYEDNYGEIIAKQCTKCSVVVGVSGYNKSKKGLAGATSSCTACRRGHGRLWYEDNRERQLVRCRQFREDNKQLRAVMVRQWEINNKERRAQATRMWAQENKDKKRVYLQKRLSRKLALPDSLTKKQWEEILQHFKGACALTGIGEIHMDHVVPLSVGHGGTIKENMIPLRDDINQSKSSASIFEWFETNRERFSIRPQRFKSLIEYLAQQNDMTPAEYRMYVDWCHDNPREVVDGELVFIKDASSPDVAI